MIRRFLIERYVDGPRRVDARRRLIEAAEKLRPHRPDLADYLAELAS